MRHSSSRVAVLAVSWVAGCFGGDSAGAGGSSSAGDCSGYCENACDAFAACSLDAGAGCVEDCTGDLGEVACEALTPLDRLTCSELEVAFTCALHCEAVCRRAAECATFDETLCVVGCGQDVPSICNPKSADARTCDQIKIEARAYEELGRALQDPGSGDFGSGGSASSGPSPTGLCTTASGCEMPLACSLETNTCGACATDAECDRGFSASGSLACIDAECAAVECVDDGDCILGGVCEEHVCRECREDADCASGVCDASQLLCAECRVDADCAASSLGAIYPACDPSTLQCVECIQDDHCAQGLLASVYHACTAEQRCVECTADAHCTDPQRPACDTSENFCLECMTNEHCQSPSWPVCSSQICTWCLSDDDCAHIDGYPFCETLQGCVQCRTNADCLDPAAPTCALGGQTCVP